MLRRLSTVFLGAAVGGMLATAAIAQQDSTINQRVNTGVVGIVSGGVNGTYIQIASDLATVLDQPDRLRVLPLVGRGSVQNITDLLYLKGVDMAIVQSDVLSYLRQNKIYRGLNRRVNYVTKLYNEEFHLLASRDVRSIQDLAGKKVNFGIDGGGTFVTASTVFRTLDIEVEPTSFDQSLALQKLKEGEIAGMVYVAGKPARLFADARGADGLHFLSIPYSTELADIYLPSNLTAADYPGLVKDGERVETVAVGAVLASFNWSSDSPRYRNLARFIDAFFTNFEQFQTPARHQKWQEVSLTARVPGWTRFKAAADWLKENEVTTEDELRASFMRFLSEMSPAAGGAALNNEQKALLFGEFMRWQRQKGQGPGAATQ